jgi:hypothetical protein
MLGVRFTGAAPLRTALAALGLLDGSGAPAS